MQNLYWHWPHSKVFVLFTFSTMMCYLFVLDYHQKPKAIGWEWHNSTMSSVGKRNPWRFLKFSVGSFTLDYLCFACKKIIHLILWGFMAYKLFPYSPAILQIQWWHAARWWNVDESVKISEKLAWRRVREVILQNEEVLVFIENNVTNGNKRS